MKQVFFILLFFTAFLCACEKDLDAFEGESGIYFDTEELLGDTVVVSWGMKAGDVKTQKIALRVMLVGNAASHDRKFTVDVVSDKTDTIAAEEGVDFEAFDKEYVIPANGAYADINIMLKRREGLKLHSRRFTVRLNETPELSFMYSRRAAVDSVTWRDVDYQRVIYMNERFPQPGWWSIAGQSRFGNWSQTKAALICDEMGIDREVWLGILGEGTFTQGYLSYVGKYMHRWLQENPTKDEDGKLMVMGPDSQN